MTKIGILTGSLRKAAYSKKVANELANLLPVRMTPVFMEIAQLPLYNADLDDADLVPAWETFRQQLDDVDSLIIVTPEYNRGMTGALKNAFDVGSKRQNHWKNKAALVASSSPGTIGGFGANQQVRQVLVTLNVIPVQRPEVYLGHVNHLFDDQGLMTNPKTIAFLQTAINAFVSLQSRLKTPADKVAAPLMRYEPGRFYIRDEGGIVLAEIIFHDQQNKRIRITDVQVSELLREPETTDQLILRVLRFAQIHQLTIIPDADQARTFVTKHPKYRRWFTLGE
ncbi:NADPH-dependent FMN reductase [Secundilactobacillus pentosiphilus]|uniref:NADPH-dependent FMN reductase n=1 Tax=Secundilactobacillus pentosiphilus TaxID=1714682 RepID=A0A1Z5INC9_9LACO|nr:NAD(P)H-dependent oxidoreductase [Secundilactobacillus pentosiphilus]GAX02941.1 NADPH-dependent FMN reductase [Secundilactobacillus pentosiphilus]